ncbi:MAG: indole-3-glycerol phosphate synthase TrpC [Sedimentisphaerales bacterium]|nr:indole-3-glycerol phosphate synthase TrpC [Sedimentisphaerales bacterium]
MGNILDKIIADKRFEVEERKTVTSLDELRDKITNLPKCRNFYKAVTDKNSRGINVIAEVKKASPSAGLIREDFDPVVIAQIYKRCGANAISVLTDEKYFQGRLEYVKQVHDAVDLPVLRKDFIIDEWQIFEARAARADAILLIADALSYDELMDLMIVAAELSLTVLLEVHNEDTLLEIRNLLEFPRKGCVVLGINNRDLTTMQVDLNTTGQLAKLLRDTDKLVSESGVKTRSDVEELIEVGVKAVLIGQTLCEHPNIEEKFIELFGK